MTRTQRWVTPPAHLSTLSADSTKVTGTTTETAIDHGADIDAEPTTTAIVAVSPTEVALPAPTKPSAPPRPTETTMPGAGLIVEAELAVRERRWRDAMRVLGAIDSVGASSVHTDGLLAIAATHLHKNRVASEAIGRLRAHPPTPGIHRHLAQVAIANHQFLLADNETRAAMALDEGPDAVEDWTHLAACYAGLGWFDEASSCLDRAEALGAEPADTWLIGRSTNFWGLSKNWASAVGLVLFLIVGLLAVAVAITVPFVARELRVTQLDERFAALANDAWAEERWLRLVHAGGVLLTVVLWAAAMQLT